MDPESQDSARRRCARCGYAPEQTLITACPRCGAALETPEQCGACLMRSSCGQPSKPPRPATTVSPQP